METMIVEQKDKIPDADKEIVNKLITDGKAIKENENITKEEIDKEIERIQNEFSVLYNKYQAAPSGPTPNPDQEIE
jgi:hypothetical protein